MRSLGQSEFNRVDEGIEIHVLIPNHDFAGIDKMDSKMMKSWVVPLGSD